MRSFSAAASSAPWIYLPFAAIWANTPSAGHAILVSGHSGYPPRTINIFAVTQIPFSCASNLLRVTWNCVLSSWVSSCVTENIYLRSKLFFPSYTVIRSLPLYTLMIYFFFPFLFLVWRGLTHSTSRLYVYICLGAVQEIYLLDACVFCVV